MALNRGLSAYRESQAKSKSKFFKLNDGQKVLIRPLVELDPDAKNYSEAQGLAVFTKEWHNPEDFTKQIVDTMDEEGACVGQELLRKYGWNGDENGGRGKADAWRPKEFMYLPCVVKDGDEEEVVVLKFNMAPKAVQANVLLDTHENSGSVTDRWFAYSRTGTGQTDTNYKLTPLDKDPKDKFDPSAYEMPDVEAAVPNVPYANQRQALGIDTPVAESRPLASAAAIDDQW